MFILRINYFCLTTFNITYGLHAAYGCKTVTVEIKLNENIAVLNKMFKMRIKHGRLNKSIFNSRQKNKWTDRKRGEGGGWSRRKRIIIFLLTVRHSVSGPMVIGESTYYYFIQFVTKRDSLWPESLANVYCPWQNPTGHDFSGATRQKRKTRRAFVPAVKEGPGMMID